MAQKMPQRILFSKLSRAAQTVPPKIDRTKKPGQQCFEYHGPQSKNSKKFEQALGK